MFVNSLGEGAIWVCDVNGPVENGDYLTTSDVPGYAMKQGEEYIANYTVAKATMSCDFADIYLPQQIHTGGINALMMDGSVRNVGSGVNVINWAASLTPNGGEVQSLDN